MCDLWGFGKRTKKKVKDKVIFYLNNIKYTERFIVCLLMYSLFFLTAQTLCVTASEPFSVLQFLAASSKHFLPPLLVQHGCWGKMNNE